MAAGGERGRRVVDDRAAPRPRGRGHRRAPEPPRRRTSQLRRPALFRSKDVARRMPSDDPPEAPARCSTTRRPSPPRARSAAARRRTHRRRRHVRLRCRRRWRRRRRRVVVGVVHARRGGIFCCTTWPAAPGPRGPARTPSRRVPPPVRSRGTRPRAAPAPLVRTCAVRRRRTAVGRYAGRTGWWRLRRRGREEALRPCWPAELRRRREELRRCFRSFEIASKSDAVARARVAPRL